MSVFDFDGTTHERLEKNRYSRNRCSPLATTIRHARIYAAGVHESRQKARRRRKAKSEEERKDTWTAEPSVTYEYECGIGPYDMQPFAYI